MPAASSTKPAGSPSGVPSGALEECTAFVIVTRRPAISIAPPLLKPTRLRDALARQPAGELVHASRRRRRVLLRDRDGVGRVVAVAVGEQDRVAALDLEARRARTGLPVYQGSMSTRAPAGVSI